MTDDTDWLKKNTTGNLFRMSLRRSSRYTQNMDESLVTNENKTKSQVLVVPHFPRKSNVPMEKIKEMNFRIPAPIKKSVIKRPVSRISKFQIGQPAFTQQSMYSKSNLNVSGTEQQNRSTPKLNARKSMFYKPPIHVRAERLDKSSSVKQNQIKQNDQYLSTKSGFQSSADISILSGSKVVNQSTPNEPALLRSILKQNPSSMRNSLNRKDSKAVKRVNFNSYENSSWSEKENEPKAMEESILSPTTEPACITSVDKKECSPGDDSTTAFADSFKPISYHETKEEQDSPECTVEKNIEKSDIHQGINSFIDLMKVYRTSATNIRMELQTIDENFKNTLKFVMDNNLELKYTSYESKKCQLYEQLKDLERDFRDKMRGNCNVKELFLSYLRKKEEVFSSQSELEKNFENTLQIMAKTHFGYKEEDVNELKKNLPLEKKIVERLSGGSQSESFTCSKGSLCKTLKERTVTPKKVTSRSISSSSGTPNNTPARRKKLSRKIEKQIRILFEE